MAGIAGVGVPVMPKWLLFLRGGIIVACLGILIAAAYNLSQPDFYITFTSGPAGFLIFDVHSLPLLSCKL